MPKRKDYLTATDFYRYLHCPHWPYFERFASAEDRKNLQRPLSDLEKSMMENGLLHEAEVVETLFAGKEVMTAPETKDAEKACEQTLELMRKGVAYIYQGTLTVGDWTGRPDLLERHDEPSKLGAWHYVPVDVKSTHALEKYQRMQLVFYATLLERLQGRFPARPAILNRDGIRIEFDAAEYISEFEALVVELERLRAGERPDPVLRKSCKDVGTWGAACEQLAFSQNDIALLYNVDVRRLRALRELGVRTVADAAEMDPVTLDGMAPGLRLHGLEVAKMQAQSLQYQWVMVREPVTLPTGGLEIHFDIESDPPNDMDYLYGILIREPSGDRYLPFVAESLEGEEGMWRAFLAWIETLPKEYHVYHFASYEHARLSVLEGRYGGSAALNEFRERMVDLKEMTSGSIVFPLYFYGLKYIAKFLGFSWRGDVKGGGQSIEVFERYLATNDRALLDSIITYNEDDVRATAHLADWLRKFARERTSFEKPYPWTSRV